MAVPRDPPSSTNISDEAVAKRTGRVWSEWFAELDRAGADAWDHKTIARHLFRGYKIDFWWAQTITVAYERARGLRDKHEQPDGYQIQVQRTLQAPAESAWLAMFDKQRRREWLREAADAKLRSAREDKRYLRLDWPDGTRVLLGVNPMGSDKCAVGVQHSKLGSADEAEHAKQAWATRLERLRGLLQG